MSFDFVPVGSVSAEKPASLKNTGTTNITVTKLTILGTGRKDFRITNDACTNAALAPTTYCQFGVVFAPTTSGTRVAHLRVDSTASCTVWITLAGSGTSTGRAYATRSTKCGSASPVAAEMPAPAPTATPSPAPAPSGVLGSNSSGGTFCAGRTTVTIHFHTGVHRRLAKAYVMVSNRKFKVALVKGKEKRSRGYYASTLSFAGLTAPSYRVKVRGKLDNGKRYARNRKFTNCVQS